jgi:hypothetical protein
VPTIYFKWFRVFRFSPYTLLRPKVQPKVFYASADVTLMASRNLPCAAICAALTRCV